jgi:hypothetical protein
VLSAPSLVITLSIDGAESTTQQPSPGFLPGLPSIPTSAIDGKGLAVDTKISQDDDNNFKGIPSEFVIDRIGIMVRLDESVSSPNSEQEITTIIRSVISGIDNCFDCIDYEVKDFFCTINENSNQ